MNRIEPIGVHDVECFHCGEHVPKGQDFSLEIQGQCRAMCCPGCRAVAELIATSGLERFYAQRTEFNQRPPPEREADPGRFTIYDDESLLRQFSTTDDEGYLDVHMLIGGVSCAACTWLIETTLQRLPGVKAASLNLTQSRLSLKLEPSISPVSEVFAQLTALGYNAQPWQRNLQQEQTQREFKTDLRRLAVAGIGMMQVGMFGIALHAGDLQGITAEYQQLLRFVSFLVTAFVVGFSARGFFASAWRHLSHGILVMDLPVALAIGLAFVASTIATVQGAGEVYFDSVVMFTFLLLLARFVEKRLRYRDALALQNAEQTLPDAVRIRRDNDWVLIPRRQLAAGDYVLVRAGDTIPIDARVTSGRSAVREDSFNGEAVPRTVDTGDHVFAGTVNVNDTLELCATGSYADTRLAALQRSIENASYDKPALAKMADRLATVFIAGVLLATIVTALIWWQIDSSRAFWIAVSVLVISCPCALSLATPASLANAAAVLRRQGIIVHGENALEALSRPSHALFDKTGTLTTGAFKLAEIETLSPLDCPQSEVEAVAAGLQEYSNHPIASAFTGIDSVDGLQDVRFSVGAGLEGKFAGEHYRMGSLDFCRDLAPGFPGPPTTSLYWVGLCKSEKPLAWLGLQDELREEAQPLLDTLRAQGIRLELLTGDPSVRARELGETLGFDQVHIGQTPEQKLRRVAQLQSEGAVVLMIGDGLNDAPVLKRADVSVAVAGATDLARSQADFVVIDGDLEQIAVLRRVAVRTRAVIRQNFAWALGYNIVGIPLAALGWVPPWMAALGMSLSSLLVVGNAARLRRPRKN